MEITPQSNDECLWVPHKVSQDSVAIYFQEVKVDGVTWKAGIRDGDQLIAINGVEIHNPGTAQYILNNVASGDTAYYIYRHNGEKVETSVEIKKLVSFATLSLALLAFVWLLVGFIVIKAKPEGYTQLIFFRSGILLVLFSIIGLLDNNYGTNPLVNIGYLYYPLWVIWFFAASFASFVIIHFFWIFPRRLKIVIYHYTEKLLYIIPTVLFIVIFTLVLYSRIEGIIVGKVVYLERFLVLLFFVNAIIGLISLYISYFKLKSQDKKPIFIILVSYTLAILAVIYIVTLANVLAGTIFNNPEFFIPIILIVVVPLSFAYSIFKYSLMDVSDVVKNAIFYGTATVTLAAVYFMLIYVVGQGISSAIGTEYQGIVAGVIFIAFAMLFQNTKDKFQDLITQKFYPEQFAYQKILVKFSKDIPTVVGLDNILNLTQAIFVEELKLNKFGIFLKSDKVYGMFRNYGLNSILENISYKTDLIKSKVAEKTALNKLPVIESEEFEEVFPDNYKKLHDEQIYTVIPLSIKSKIIGFLMFGLKYSGARFAGKDLDLLIAAANQFAVSVENARLYESEAEKMKIERDLENARKIQESLLPRELPKFNNLEVCGTMISAMQVGGDYFDLIKVSDTKLFVIIGDVSGKGLSASFYMTKLQTMIRLYCNENTSPSKILYEVNKKIYESIEKNWFITVSIGLFDLEKNVLKFCRAGHTPLLEINNSGSKLYQSKGLGVGLEKGEIFNANLEEMEIPLSHGSNYIFFSDGVSEAMNEKNELFGITRLEKAVINSSTANCSSVVQTTLKELKHFRASYPQNDDITLVVVKYF